MTRGTFRRLRREEDGLVAGAESLLFGVLIFFVGSSVVINAWSVVDADFAANAAAREATRAVVESSAASEDAARQLAQDVAEETMRGHHKLAAPTRVEFLSYPWGPGGLQRCARVTIQVRYTVDAINMPFLGSFVPVDAVGEHTELVDPLRSGLSGTADCA